MATYHTEPVGNYVKIVKLNNGHSKNAKNWTIRSQVLIMGIIYMITCQKNGKKYIGQTQFSAADRWKEHCYCASVLQRAKNSDPLINTNCSYYKQMKTSTLYNSMALHGIESFTFEVVEEIPNSELNDAEKLYIEEYNSMLPNGYNATSGGDSKYTHTAEAIRKMVERKLDTLDENRHEYLQTLPPKTTYSAKHNAIILVGHPLCKYKMFRISKYETLENTQEAVINFVDSLERENVIRMREKKETDLKPYPGIKTTKKGYKLEKYINGTKYQAGFESQKFTREENKRRAIEYYTINILPIIPN
jgi:group I intron endonuclease